MIRTLIAEGRVHRAALCLGRPYALTGRVIPGAGRGRSIGFPTANVGELNQLLPADGVYAGTVRLPMPQQDGGVGVAAPAAWSATLNPQYNRDRGRSMLAGISVGTNPTFGGTARRVEAHVVGFSGDAMGQPIVLEFGIRLREQRAFESGEALARQIAGDIEAVRRWADT